MTVVLSTAFKSHDTDVTLGSSQSSCHSLGPESPPPGLEYCLQKGALGHLIPALWLSFQNKNRPPGWLWELGGKVSMRHSNCHWCSHCSHGRSDRAVVLATEWEHWALWEATRPHLPRCPTSLLAWPLQRWQSEYEGTVLSPLLSISSYLKSGSMEEKKNMQKLSLYRMNSQFPITRTH